MHSVYLYCGVYWGEGALFFVVGFFLGVGGGVGGGVEVASSTQEIV